MIIPLKTVASAPLRMFCFPYAGGGAWAYRKWKDALVDDVALYSIQLPGRENRIDEAPITSMPAMRARLAEEIAPYLDRPFIFFGHSLGSLIAFECVRELRDRGLPLPQRMIVSGRRAPHIGRTEKPWHSMSDVDLMAELKNLGGTPDGILENAELRALFLPVLRADFGLNEAYVHREEAPLPMVATMLRGTDDPTTSLAQAEEWRRHFSSPVRFVEYGGGHFFIDSHFPAVIAQVNAELVAALALVRSAQRRIARDPTVAS